MVDKYVNWANNGWGKKVAKKLGLPQPVKLKRYSKDRADVNSKVLIGAFEADICTIIAYFGRAPCKYFYC